MQDVLKLLINLTQKLGSVHHFNREVDAVMDLSYDGIWITDGTGKTVRVNGAVERITGLASGALLGRNIDAVMDGDIMETCSGLDASQQSINGRLVIVNGCPILDDAGIVESLVFNLRELSELNELKSELEQARFKMEKYHREAAELRALRMGTQRLVANSKAMADVIDAVHRVARLKTSVLLVGKSGVGKEAVARLVHMSGGQNGSFVKVNCRSIPGEMLEIILFGREQQGMAGEKSLFELASGGTLFIKEVADIPPNLQKKLLDAIADGQITRVGGTIPVKVDVRVIAATERNLNKLVKYNRVRKDFCTGLNAVAISIPPLNKRREDIPVLLQYYTRLYNEKHDCNKRLSIRAMELLVDYEWPENVRELVNLVERLIITVEQKLIMPKHLPSYIFKSVNRRENNNFKPLKEAVAELEFELIKNAVDIYGSTYKAAHILGVSQPTVVRKLQKYAKKAPEVPSVSAAEGS